MKLCLFLNTEIAIHFARQLIFVAANNGLVYRISAKEKEKTIQNISSSVIALTADWLHDHLYLATANTVSKSKFGVSYLLIVVTRLFAGCQNHILIQFLSFVSSLIFKKCNFFSPGVPSADSSIL